MDLINILIEKNQRDIIYNTLYCCRNLSKVYKSSKIIDLVIKSFKIHSQNKDKII